MTILTGKRCTRIFCVTDRPPRRGEVWLARIDKVRPIIVRTRDPLGSLLNKIIVVPVTSGERGIATEVPLEPAEGVRGGSVASLDNMQFVRRSRLLQRLGRARP